MREDGASEEDEIRSCRTRQFLPGKLQIAVEGGW